MSGARILEALGEATALARAIPDGGFGLCPLPGPHIIGPWDTSFTGGREGVSCRKCHKTWLKVDGVYVETHDHNLSASDMLGAKSDG